MAMFLPPAKLQVRSTQLFQVHRSMFVGNIAFLVFCSSKIRYENQFQAVGSRHCAKVLVCLGTTQLVKVEVSNSASPTLLSGMGNPLELKLHM